MLWTIIGILIVLWILGLVFKIAGGIIHILLVIAVIVLVYKLIVNRGKR
ncbi:lmo0937 family membrane protein [Bacillus salacetis]|uniref:Lmo0937 family membrane protein n=1 Tax=Bacillus salacetis TaxID=2315464 RepID=A0A3A1R0V5_9BACI|nr:lmo0937 family membrane protein [Bacillus salacetis]RIW33243.1 lmo0937 family membrane protein [Bacillus salacetis]